MKKIIYSAIFVLYIQGAKAQQFNPLLASMLQDTLDTYVTAITNVKGMSASVYVPGQGIWQGVSAVSHSGHPVTPGMKFGIASNTKLFVATAMLKLAESNAISLDDSIHKWLPLYPNINPKITIRQLLNHTSGVSDPIFLAPWMDTIMKHPMRVFTPAEVLGWVGAPLFPAGTSWGYSNINYILAGMVAESATGFHISKIIRDSILTPLNLSSTFYDVEEPESDTLAHRWFNAIDYHDTSRIGLNSAGGCAGALFSTSADMVNWYHALFSGQVLNASSFAELMNFVPTGTAYTYSLGLERQPFFGHTTWGHGGSTWGYKSRMVYDPCMGVAVCGLVNAHPAGSDGITLLLYSVLANHLPGCGASISGTATVCQGTTGVTYTVPAITHATSYQWSLPSGASGASVTNSITVNYGLAAVSGNITVKGVNIYGEGATATFSVIVKSKPVAPVITQNGNNLTSDALAGNQWHDANGIIAGAINQLYTPLADGDYYAIVTLDGCSSDTSNIIHFIHTGLHDPSGMRALTLYPNPVASELIIVQGNHENIPFEILNSMGLLVYTGILTEKTIINTADFKTGLYIVKPVNGKSFECKRFVRE